MPETASATLLERAGTRAAGIGSIGEDRPRLRRGLEIAMVVAIAIFLAAFVASQWSSLPDHDWHFSPGWLALSAGGVVLFYFVQSEAWYLMIRALGESIDPRQARAIWGKSLIARYVPTNALMVVGRLVMAERQGVSKRVCLASLVYEVGLQFATAIVVGAYFVINLPQLDDQPARYVVLALIPIALVVFHPRIFHPLADRALRKLGRETLPQTLSLGRIVEFCAIYVVAWLAIGLGVVGFAAAVHSIELSDIAYAGAAYPVAFCVAVLTFVVPGGLGTRDAALALSLAAVLPPAVATAIAVGFRIFQTAIELLYVAGSTALARRSPSS